MPDHHVDHKTGAMDTYDDVGATIKTILLQPVDNAAEGEGFLLANVYAIANRLPVTW